MRVDDRRGVGMPGVGKRLTTSFQNSISYLLRSEGEENSHISYSDIARVIKVNTDTNTVDIKSWTGAEYLKVPYLADTGVILNEEEEQLEVYGILDLPRENDYVLVPSSETSLGPLSNHSSLKGSSPILSRTFHNEKLLSAPLYSCISLLIEYNCVLAIPAVLNPPPEKATYGARYV